MELDERKQKILYAIIQNYQETGEPVGSRTISKMDALNFSPATIRNEMADLEELGYIVQPHTSAGRVPTDKGYRFYVDRMLAERAESDPRKDLQLPAAPMQELLTKRIDRVEELLLKMAQILAANTNYTTMVTGPHSRRNKLKFLQLSAMEDRKILAVVVLGGNIVKNNILEIDEELSQETLLNLNFMLNNRLNGLSLEEINLGLISQLKEEAGGHIGVIEKVLDAVADTFAKEDSYPIYTSGATNIFRYPELTGGDKASELISTLEEKKELGSAIGEISNDSESHQDIRVYIGDEVPVDSMKDCSVVTATYELGDGVQGKIGIIGPKRMNYQKVVDTLKGTMHQLDGIFKKSEE
ncbi:MAG: heat-inducible transcription repressor HrcA [Lachnospiraceae bacterium]|nr:heat-inducible transcription repressor HrcA [Lachnospiraceae bacterium]